MVVAGGVLSTDTFESCNVAKRALLLLSFTTTLTRLRGDTAVIFLLLNLIDTSIPLSVTGEGGRLRATMFDIIPFTLSTV